MSYDKHAMQTGYVFDVPKRSGGKGRMTSDHVSKVITKIGKRAGVIVNDDGKAVSAHDLRRSFGKRFGGCRRRSA